MRRGSLGRRGQQRHLLLLGETAEANAPRAGQRAQAVLYLRGRGSGASCSSMLPGDMTEVSRAAGKRDWLETLGFASARDRCRLALRDGAADDLPRPVIVLPRTVAPRHRAQ